MGDTTTIINDHLPNVSLGKQTQWMRVTFAGLTMGDPPSATFQACLTLRNGTARHVSQGVRVTDEGVLLRLVKLPAGTQLRVCTETDWDAAEIPVTLKDFCCLSPDVPGPSAPTTAPDTELL